MLQFLLLELRWKENEKRTMRSVEKEEYGRKCGKWRWNKQLTENKKQSCMCVTNARLRRQRRLTKIIGRNKRFRERDTKWTAAKPNDL